ncbi:MAG TPA: class I SAM-dependent methyltransferase [Myxococcota bacterium]|nr:class I SAM-dependent methyltransferase [Myxococcota bacterium]
MIAIHDPRITTVLDRLHRAADGDFLAIATGLLRSLGKPRPGDMAQAYIAVSREQGRLLYGLARSIGARNMVEFGASFGISALWLGAAARDNGGRLVTTEIEPTKVEAARAHIAEAGLDDVVTLLAGDATDTLRSHPGPVDLLYLDGWSDLYFDILALMEPKLRPGATVLMDNASFPRVQPFLRHLRSSPRYVSTPLQTDKFPMELAVYLGPVGEGEGG